VNALGARSHARCMRRWRAEMPFALALIASALLHVAALVGPNWSLPGLDEADNAPTLDAVLVKTPPAVTALPSPTPPPPAKKPVREKPRTVPVASTNAVSPAPTFVPEAPVVVAEAAAAPTPEITPVAAPVVTPAPVVKPALIALPAKGRVRYAITRGEGGFVVGQAVHTWEQDGFAYTLRSVTETTGIAALFKPARVVQESRGEVTAAGLVPTEFRHERVGGLDTASFDWARQLVRYAGREDPVSSGTQDMLSMYYQAVMLLPQQGASGRLEMAIATGRKLDRYRFDVLGEVTLTTSLGEKRATHLRTKSGSDTIELWIAADVPGLPLKIRFIDRKGEIFDQLAEELSMGSSAGKLGEKP